MENCLKIVEQGNFVLSRPDLLIGKAYDCLKYETELIGYHFLLE